MKTLKTFISWTAIVIVVVSIALTIKNNQGNSHTGYNRVDNKIAKYYYQSELVKPEKKNLAIFIGTKCVEYKDVSIYENFQNNGIIKISPKVESLSIIEKNKVFKIKLNPIMGFLIYPLNKKVCVTNYE